MTHNFRELRRFQLIFHRKGTEPDCQNGGHPIVQRNRQYFPKRKFAFAFFTTFSLLQFLLLPQTPTFALVLETLLLITVIWLLLHRRGGCRRRQLTKEEEDRIIADYEPEPLVADTDPNHPLLHTRVVQSRVGKRIQVDGHDCLNLGSHNYLGFLEDQEILEEACKSLRKYGVGSCGPRGFYGTMDVHLDLEDRIAKFMGLEEAIVYSYGFSTVASAIPAYAKRGDLIFV